MPWQLKTRTSVCFNLGDTEERLVSLFMTNFTTKTYFGNDLTLKDMEWLKPITEDPEVTEKIEEMIAHKLNRRPSFDWEVADCGVYCGLWVFGDDVCIEDIILVVRMLATIFPSVAQKAPWRISWAEAADECSADTVDQYAGGAVIFDTERELYHRSRDLDEQRFKEWIANG